MVTAPPLPHVDAEVVEGGSQDAEQRSRSVTCAAGASHKRETSEGFVSAAWNAKLQSC